MKLIAYTTKRKVRLNAAARTALGVRVEEYARIAGPNGQIERPVRKAFKAAASLNAAMHAAYGIYGIALTNGDMIELGVRPGDQVEVTNTSAPVVAFVPTAPAAIEAPATATRAALPAPAPKGNGKTTVPVVDRKSTKLSLKDRLATLKVGEALSVSASAANGGAHKLAKEIGITITKVGPTMVKRKS